MTRRVLAPLALLLFGLGAGLALVEVGLRLLPAGPGVDLRGLHEARPDRPWLYGLRPGAEATLARTGQVRYAVNADGFRDARYARPKPAGTFRIVVLGDSVAFGYGVPQSETFVKVLEQRLAAAAVGTRIEVLNLGVSGYNPYTEAALFADVGASYAPDLVLIQFCVNDLNDPTLHFNASTLLALGEIPAEAFPDPAARGHADRPSRLAAACRRLRVCVLVADRDADDASPPAAVAAALAPHATPSATELAWLAARYDEVVRIAARAAAPVVVVVFPYSFEVDGRASPLAARLAELGRVHGWKTFDLLPAFRHAAAAGGPPLFLDLWHPTAAGHRVAAAAIADQLACAGLVPGGGDSACPPP